MSKAKGKNDDDAKANDAKAESPTVQMDAPDDAEAASFDGEEYAVKNGKVTVPREAVATLLCHGFKTSSKSK